MECLGIQFAPLNIPFERRIQTFSLACWLILMVLGQFFCMFAVVYLVLFTKFWWLMLLYILWIWAIDKNISEMKGRPVAWVRSWVLWKYTRDYFPLRFKKVPFVELDPKKNYLFCCFPHGVFSFGACNAFGTEYGNFKNYFPHHTPHMATMNMHYRIPFFRELAMSLGGIPVNWQSIGYILSRPQGGQVCALIVGGSAEVQRCRPGDYSLVLKKRKGFVKLALKNGAPLVPVLSFGETSIYREANGAFARFCKEIIMKWTGVDTFIPAGRGFFQYTFGLLPLRGPITTVVGHPVDVSKIEEPTTEHVDEYHQKFVRALTGLFEEQKHNYVEKPEETFLRFAL